MKHKGDLAGEMLAGEGLGSQQKLLKALSFEKSLRWKAKFWRTPENWPLEMELDSCPNGRLSLSLSPLVLYCISYS